VVAPDSNALGLGARKIDVRFEIDVNEVDLIAVLREHLRSDQRAAMTALPGLGIEPRARQQHGDFERRGLAAHHRRRGEKRGGRGAAGQKAAAGEPGAGDDRHGNSSRGRGDAMASARGTEANDAAAAAQTTIYALFGKAAFTARV